MEVTVLRPQVGNGSGEFDATAMELKSAEKQFSIWDLGAGTSVGLLPDHQAQARPFQ